MRSVQRPRRVVAVVLTGGAATRMGGADKASAEVGGRTMLEHVLAAVAGLDETVVVGDPVPTSVPVTWAREEPGGGGPAAGVLAGTDAATTRAGTPPELVCVLACDMPHVREDTVARLVAAARQPRVDGAVLVDASGRAQWLCGAYRYDALLAARPAYPERESGMAMRRLVGDLDLQRVPALGQEARDVDTWQDLRDLDR